MIVPPHSVKLFRVAPVRAHPWVLSTDIHIRPDQAELTKIAWDEAVRSLRLRPTRDGKVFLRVPKEFRVTEPADLWIAKDGNDASLSVRVVLGPEERVVRFVPLEAAGKNLRDESRNEEERICGAGVSGDLHRDVDRIGHSPHAAALVRP